MQPRWIDERDEKDLLDLSEDDVSVVKTYVNWLYSGNIDWLYFKSRMSERRDLNLLVLVGDHHLLPFGVKYLDAHFVDAVRLIVAIYLSA